jgi:uncharacterized protein YbjQ (UPF0145 family)
MTPHIVVTTGSDVPGCRVVQIHGVVRGITLRTAQSNRSLEHATEERKAAEHRLIEQAKLLGAEAVIGMRYDSSTNEVVAYGTAVRLKQG